MGPRIPAIKRSEDILCEGLEVSVATLHASIINWGFLGPPAFWAEEMEDSCLGGHFLRKAVIKDGFKKTLHL